MNDSSSVIDFDTGEVREDSEQLMFGFEVPVKPRMERQRRGTLVMTPGEFRRTHWALDTGDSITVKCDKEGDWIVTVKKAWEGEL